MSHQAEVWIDVEAARALVRWKSLFAKEVTVRARQLAAESSEPNRVTLAHCQQAVQSVASSLSATLLDGGDRSGDRKIA